MPRRFVVVGKTFPAQRQQAHEVEAEDEEDDGDGDVADGAEVAKQPPSEAVITPISAMEASTPSENTRESRKARLVEASSWVEMKPTTSGTLARWQGLKTMLTTPQANAASRAQPSDWLRPLLRLVRICSSTARYCVAIFSRPRSTRSASMSACG